MTAERTLTLAQHIASALEARLNCAGAGDLVRIWDRALVQLENFLPHDRECKIDLDASMGSKIVVHLECHHMDDDGMHGVWTDYTVTVRPAFQGFDISVSGRGRSGIKDRLEKRFNAALSAPVVQTAEGYHTELSQ
jgi:hypothetical protein